MALSASPVQEELQPERKLRNQLASAVRSINWSYALFWSISSTQPGSSHDPSCTGKPWTNGFYNDEVKTRKIANSTELTANQLVMQRSEQLRELYEALLSGECDRRMARPIASLSPEDLGDTEWYYVLCMTYTFQPGQGLPGRSFASNEHIWLCNAHLADSKAFPRALLAKVLEDPDLVSRATASFWEMQLPTCSEEPRPNPSANDIVLEDLDIYHNATETIIAAGGQELGHADSLSNASLEHIAKEIDEFYALCTEMDVQPGALTGCSRRAHACPRSPPAELCRRPSSTEPANGTAACPRSRSTLLARSRGQWRTVALTRASPSPPLPLPTGPSRDFCAHARRFSPLPCLLSSPTRACRLPLACARVDAGKRRQRPRTPPAAATAHRAAPAPIPCCPSTLFLPSTSYLNPQTKTLVGARRAAAELALVASPLRCSSGQTEARNSFPITHCHCPTTPQLLAGEARAFRRRPRTWTARSTPPPAEPRAPTASPCRTGAHRPLPRPSPTPTSPVAARRSCRAATVVTEHLKRTAVSPSPFSPTSPARTRRRLAGVRTPASSRTKLCLLPFSKGPNSGLADGVYELVPAAEEIAQESEVNVVHVDPSPEQEYRFEPEGKPRSIT
ncbi:hypothetical protein HU200_032810 [Digitaria exilis]|uniref:Transcription factor MYC/MYB N-terminal domain-containing protein n=1 Tax=Digitaria exilis TaxID=1010633 RepID=A0A835ENH6_9POAL|nr:hypothetical protein HU200_032810 [Digitaria exilis]